MSEQNVYIIICIKAVAKKKEKSWVEIENPNVLKV